MRQIRKWEVDAMCLRLLASVVLSSAVPRKQSTSARVGWAKVKKQGLRSGCACQGRYDQETRRLEDSSIQALCHFVDGDGDEDEEEKRAQDKFEFLLFS